MAQPASQLQTSVPQPNGVSRVKVKEIGLLYPSHRTGHKERVAIGENGCSELYLDKGGVVAVVTLKNGLVNRTLNPLSACKWVLLED